MANKEKDLATSLSENESAAKRRPGRPRKAVAEEVIAVPTIETEQAPKKRGRKPKTAVEQASLLDANENKNTNAAAQTLVAENSEKSKRGRPAKAKVNKDLVQSSNEALVQEENTPKAKNPRVRRANSTKNVQAQPNEPKHYESSNHADEHNVIHEKKGGKNHPKNKNQVGNKANFDEEHISTANDNGYNQQGQNQNSFVQNNSQNAGYTQYNQPYEQQENDHSKRRMKKPRNDNRNNRSRFQQPQYDNAQNNYGEQDYSQNNFDYSYNQPKNQRSRGQNNFNQKQRNSKQTNAAFNDVGFDNSSIIAAITGKTIDYDMSLHQVHDDTHSNDFAQFQGHNKKNHDNRNKSRHQNSKNRPNHKKQRNQQFQPHAPMPEFAHDDSLISQFKSYGTKPTFDYPNEQVNHQEQTQNIQEFELETNDPAMLAIESKPKHAQHEEHQPQEQKHSQSRNYRNENFAAEELHGQPQKSNYSQNLKMYIGVQPEEQIEIALADNKVIVEYFVEMSHQAKIRGNIYKGVIHNVDPNLQAVFVNFGAERNGFLQIDEVHPDYYLTPHTANKNHKFPLISKVLRPGQEILVQIVKEPTGTKGAFLTTWISLAGRFLVLTPGQEQIGVSRKVTDHEERARLRDLLEGIDPGEDMGIIIRTAAANATREDIEADLEYLQNLWVDIVERANVATPLNIIHQEVDLAERVMRDYLTENIREIWTDDPHMADRMNEITKHSYPHKRKMVKLHSDPRQSLWERFNLQTQINEITSREVALPSGGRVAFDQTEALMAIDINSGKTQNKASFHSMVLQTNIEAAQAIARHLRLRDIGGQIVVDFIELRDKSSVREVEKAFHEAMKPDRARYEIGSISPFGLLEIVRQRIGSSAISISSEPCPHCKGTGIRRNMEWQAQDALKEIARKARAEKTIKYTHVVEKELALYLLNTKRDRIQEIEEQLSKRIEIVI